MDEEKYLKLYTIAHNNAVKLLADAEILMEHKSYPTAYFLALSALEEISKSQCAADVSTGVMKEKHFWEIYQNHPAKIGFMDEYSERANEYPDKIKWNGPDDIEIVSPETPTFEKRMQHYT